jgi:hypothetical protein
MLVHQALKAGPPTNKTPIITSACKPRMVRYSPNWMSLLLPGCTRPMNWLTANSMSPMATSQRARPLVPRARISAELSAQMSSNAVGNVAARLSKCRMPRRKPGHH